MNLDRQKGGTFLAEFLETYYKLRGTIREMAGYQDYNYHFTDTSGESYILKITADTNDLEFIGSQNRVLTELSKKPLGTSLPCPVANLSGDLVTEIIHDGRRTYARLFTYIDGEFLAESKPALSFFRELGKVFARIDYDMIGLEDAVLKCRTHEWDLGRVLEVAEDVHIIKDPADRRLVHYFLMQYREQVQPVYHSLQKGLIHGDGNDWNILVGKHPVPAFAGMTEEAAFAGMTEEGSGTEVKGPRLRGDDRKSRFRGDDKINGIIDFGDMVWGARVHEVAIVLAYAMMGRKDFSEIYQEVVNGYQELIRLTDLELKVLYYLVAARWCQTMVLAARQELQNPESSYHQVSVQGARAMLHQWIRENPGKIVKGVRDFKEVGEVEGVKGNGERYGYFSRAVSLSYKVPIRMVGAAMQYMYGEDGRTYLDCVNNIPHVGHCHPKVVEAGQRQMARLNTNTRYLYDSLDRYAEKLLSKFPPSLNKVFFVNSGSAATDLAVRLAEAHTGGCRYLVLDYAYHGNTVAAIGLSPYKFNRKGGRGKPANVTILPTNPELVGTDNYLVETDNYLSLRTTFFAESIVGCAGQIVLSKEFMQKTVREVREAGGIYVADEVQTGFGRVGHKFWAYELYDVVPDIVILGKPMGNGHPMGAVVCTEEIARSFETGMEFFSSFGGNPVSCEIGLAVLEVIEEERLQENARVVGDYLIGELRSLAGSRQKAVGSRQSADGSRDAYLRPSEQSADGSRDAYLRPSEQSAAHSRDAYLRPSEQSADGSRDAYLRPSEQSAADSRDAYLRPSEQSAAHSRDAYLRPSEKSAVRSSHHASRVTFHVSEVRGSGLFLGIELAETETGKPAAEAAGSIVNSMKERGFLLSTDGPFNNVIKFKPPMCFSMRNAEELLTAFKGELFELK